MAIIKAFPPTSTIEKSAIYKLKELKATKNGALILITETGSIWGNPEWFGIKPISKTLDTNGKAEYEMEVGKLKKSIKLICDENGRVSVTGELEFA